MWTRVLLGCVVCASSTVWGQRTTQGFGSGRTGALTVGGRITVNTFVRLRFPANAGVTSVQVEGSGVSFSPGELVMFHQPIESRPVASGDAGPVGAASKVGRFELARIATTSGTTLTLAAPLAQDWPAAFGETQIVTVPEYTDLVVPAGSSIESAPWDGTRGGVVAFFVSGTLFGGGIISASGAGFRGGAAVTAPYQGQCSGLDEPTAQRGAFSGEGLAIGRFGVHMGRGNQVNGGGGGVCDSSGGGGGGGWGLGGQGGFSFSRETGGSVSRNVGGLGGAPISLIGLWFGGGGGAGYIDASGGAPGTGGRGGGAILIQANAIRFTGRLEADGTNGDSALGGACGGGAGGTIIVDTSASGFHSCGPSPLRANGGRGGSSADVNGFSGPGGGGGGGLVVYQGGPTNCRLEANNGLSGRDGANTPYGSTPTVIGPPWIGRVSETILDAGPLDAGAVDGGAFDAGPSDAGDRDGGQPGGEGDGGPIDAGGVLDAGPDASLGHTPDANELDASVLTDAGLQARPVPREFVVGCSAAPLTVVFSCLLLVLVSRRSFR